VRRRALQHALGAATATVTLTAQFLAALGWHTLSTARFI
jgi:hypothetical protein